MWLKSDEIWKKKKKKAGIYFTKEKKKKQGHCQEHFPLPTLCNPSRRCSKYERILVLEPILSLNFWCNAWSLYRRGWGGYRQGQQTNRQTSEACTNMEVQEQRTRAEFQGKAWFLLCNEGKHLQTVDQATSSRKKKNLWAAWGFKTADTHTHTETIQHKLLFNSGANSRTSLASEEGRAFDWIKMYSSTSAISTHTHSTHGKTNKHACAKQRACIL